MPRKTACRPVASKAGNSPPSDAGMAYIPGADPFWMDTGPVTNRIFARFVNETGYTTQAECSEPAEPGASVPGAFVFQITDGPADNWTFVPGAYWRMPEGRGSDLFGRERHPVIHVSFEDARAFAKWAAKELPTEAEWEFAAGGGLETCGEDPANGYGVFDMAGNIWEWTATRAEDPNGLCACRTTHSPRGSSPLYVVKGGPHLRAARHAQPAGSAMSHLGFRCIQRQKQDF